MSRYCFKTYRGRIGVIVSEKKLNGKHEQADSANHEAGQDVPETIGEFLCRRRQSRNISLEEISAATGITTTILQALENEEREELPAEVYIKAFYKKYAQYLGVDSDEIQAKYQKKARKLKKKGKQPDFNTVITIKGQEENLFAEILHRLLLPIGIIILGILIYWFYTNYLADSNPFVFLRVHFPAVYSFFHENPSVLSG